MPKQARLSRIKRFRCYTIEEAAEVSGVSSRTIRNWAKAGLRVMENARPALIRGDDLHNHIKSQRAKRSVKTKIDTFYCVCCRAERRAAEGIVDCDLIGRRAKLTALCMTCGTVLTKPIAVAAIPEISRTLDLRIRRHE
ncbi:helix-turn-helix domain-containing protein [Tropicibacter sp. R16_0]|uniref:helix-turn-helix domain-containing protein n=1 Tax=Tropicibacter sp. R16_0 TaxID=2821102 RepID=UPI001ADD48D5|nr:helix-turn-helix domain-containing protein [Tropicibacter sp. R16_0]MBO9451068.1 helix-turn-helix domain-containing protein [Tropicibacter sp. R16_0]